MASTKLYLDLRGRAKDGCGSILVVIAHNRTTTTVSTGIRVRSKDWDGNKVIHREDADLLNAELSRFKNNINTHIALLRLDNSLESMTAPEIKASIDKPKKKSPGTSISSVFEDYLLKDLSEGTKGLYRATLEKIDRYTGSGTKIEEVDYKWIIGFERFLARTRGVNGRAIDLRNFRAVCNHAMKLGLLKQYPFAGYSVKQEETRKRSIPIEQLREFYHYPCTPRRQMFKDYFFLMLFLIGISSVDLFLAKKEQIVNGRLDYIRRKTHKKYSIKIEPETQKLLDKYSGRNYLVDVMDHCKSHINFLHEMNNELKLIGPTKMVEEYNKDDLFQVKIIEKVEPIIPDITSYWARHTWSTLAYQLDIPMDTISQALGHSFANKTTMIYVRQDQTKVDKANRAVIDYLLG